jgi:hypothetical protein
MLVIDANPKFSFGSFSVCGSDSLRKLNWQYGDYYDIESLKNKEEIERLGGTMRLVKQRATRDLHP